MLIISWEKFTAKALDLDKKSIIVHVVSFNIKAKLLIYLALEAQIT